MLYVTELPDIFSIEDQAELKSQLFYVIENIRIYAKNDLKSGIMKEKREEKRI